MQVCVISVSYSKSICHKNDKLTQELLDEADQLPLNFTIFNNVSVSESLFSHVQATDDTFSSKKRRNAS
jgi:hypothetical protein